MSDPNQKQSQQSQQLLGGIVHTYQKYDPAKFPSAKNEAADLVSPVFEHMLQFGSMREFSEEEIANAIRLDPRQFAGLGPSLDQLIRMLEERRRKILATYETDSVQKKAGKSFRKSVSTARCSTKNQKAFRRGVRDEQIYVLEQLWYRMERSDPEFASDLLRVMEALGDKYQIDFLASNWNFTGQKSLTTPEAIDLLDELNRIEELLKQLEDAKQNAQLAIIDLEELSEFADSESIENMKQFQQQVQEYLQEAMKHQGVVGQNGQVQLSPKAYRLFQGKLLDRIFSDLKASRSGRHPNAVDGEGAVETQRTRPYEFGDSVAQMDIPQTMINAMLRQPEERPLRLHQDDIEIHATRNHPKCATVVLMDMSGSMRYDSQYVNVKKMGLALNGLITSEFPGDFLRFIEVATFAKVVPAGELISLMPKIPTITNPVVRLKADMSREEVTELHIPPHFTNIQHGMSMARRFLSTQDSPNRQVVLITDGLPTAHFEGSDLFLLYPPDPETEQATMREGMLCQREDITINIFLLPSWSQSHEDVQFAHRLAQSTGGRVFFTAGSDLDRYVVWDYVNQRRDIIG